MFETFETLIQTLLTKEFILKATNEFGWEASSNFSNIGDTLAELNDIKWELNQTKSKIHKIVKKYGREKWLSYTAFTHPMKSLPKSICEAAPEIQLCTQAYCKFVEILIKYPKLTDYGEKEFSSLHLCEAPGAFVSALNDFLCKRKQNGNWKFYMNSLNPYNEWNDAEAMFTADEFIGPNLKRMIFGRDDSGNIFNWNDEFLDEIVHKYGKFDLITADGSVDCQENPDVQETTVCELLAKEVEIALKLISAGGNFVFKIFTLFEEATLNIVLKLIGSFEKLHCYKPSSSKPGNSEVKFLE